MKKLTDKTFYVITAVITFLIILGMVLILFWVRNLQESMDAMEDRHLMDEAEVADSDLARILRRLRNEIQEFAEKDEVRNAEADYAVLQDREAFAGPVLDLSRTFSSWVKGMRVLYNEKEIYVYNASPDRGPLPESPEAISDMLSIFVNAGDEGYLLCTYGSSGAFRYDLYISLEQLLSVIADPVVPEDSPDTTVFLYDRDAGIYAGRRSGKLRVTLASDDPSANSDILAIIIGLEAQGTADTWKLLVTDEEQVTHTLAGAAISSVISENGRFAVGLITDNLGISEEGLKNARKVITSILLLILGLLGMLLLVLVFYKRNQAKEAKILEMDEINREAEQRFLDARNLEQRDRLETIGVLSSSIAHEFNNLLTPIMGYSAMSMSLVPDTEEELLENLSAIYSASSRAKTLVSRMSVFSKRDDGASFRLLSPDALIGEVGTLLAPSVPPFVDVKTELNCPEPCILGDRIRLIQLFVNLSVNAFQAMKEGGGTLTVITEHEGSSVRVIFSDTGKGIPKEKLSEIFEPFYTTKGEGGTGLGLPIARRIAEGHNAELLVDSAPGCGTTFTVVFPYREE